MLERSLFSLPARLGGLGVGIPTDQAEIQYPNSIRIASSLANIITGKEKKTWRTHPESKQLQVGRERQWNENDKLNHLMEELPPNTKKVVQLSCEKEASTWLTAMP